MHIGGCKYLQKKRNLKDLLRGDQFRCYRTLFMRVCMQILLKFPNFMFNWIVFEASTEQRFHKVRGLLETGLR